MLWWDDELVNIMILPSQSRGKVRQVVGNRESLLNV